MVHIQLKFLVLGVGILFPATTKGAYEQCVTFLRNTVVYEGAQNTMFSCANGPNGTEWMVRPTSNAAVSYQITNYNDVVSPTLTGLYAFNETGLTVRNATTLPTGGPISTAGTYIVSFNTTTRIAFKLVVIRSGPICSCNQWDSDNISISCTIIYAEHPYYPINAIVDCTANDGQFYTSTTPMKIFVPSTPIQYVYNSTSTITVNNTDPTTYDCLMTFAAPTGGPPVYLAKNAPDFSVARQVFCGQTTTMEPMTTTQPTITTKPLTTTESTVTTMPATTTTLISTTGCNCAQSTTCPSLNESCTKSSECRSDGTNLTNVYSDCVVKTELYVRYDSCCPDDLVCGVVVTLRNDSRWLIHDSQCEDNKCEMVVVRASCMSSNWKLLTERKIIISGVGDYVEVGNSVSISMTDCSESCKKMMSLL